MIAAAAIPRARAGQSATPNSVKSAPGRETLAQQARETCDEAGSAGCN
jgi:hypothetical protein